MLLRMVLSMVGGGHVEKKAESTCINYLLTSSLAITIEIFVVVDLVCFARYTFRQGGVPDVRRRLPSLVTTVRPSHHHISLQSRVYANNHAEHEQVRVSKASAANTIPRYLIPGIRYTLGTPACLVYSKYTSTTQPTLLSLLGSGSEL